MASKEKIVVSAPPNVEPVPKAPASMGHAPKANDFKTGPVEDKVHEIIEDNDKGIITQLRSGTVKTVRK
jgi:hypothetical protein